MNFDVSIEISLRPGISDPQGATIQRSLPALGFQGVTDVRVGKHIWLSIEAESEDEARKLVESMCERFLANPVIEDARITVAQPAGVN